MQSPRFYEFGPFRLDSRERLLLRETQPLSLTPKSFDTLVLLVENTGRLMEKEVLIHQLWPETAVEENSLSQCIYLLRKILSDNHGKNRYIETVPRHGYRFVAPVRKIFEGDDQPGLNNGPEPRTLSEAKVELSSTRSGSAVSPRRSHRFTLVIAVAMVMVAVLVGTGAIVFRTPVSSAERPNSKIPKSLAVLPFKLLNSDRHDEYLGLGLADALITRFSENGEFNVRPIEDVQKYSSRIVDPVTAGRELGVGAVLDGSVQRDGDKVRITLQLLNVGTGTPLWAERLDTSFVSMFEVEDTVANEVSKTLVPELTPSPPHRTKSLPTTNAEAYEDYMKGRFFWNKRTAHSLNKAVQFFQQAIAKDPGYAQAYAGMADSYALLGFYDFLPPAESYPKAEQAALRALVLDDGLAEAHASLLSIKTDYDWDWVGAEREFQRAIELNPNYAPAYQWHAYVRLATGHVDGAIADLNHAMQLDPLSPGIYISSAWPYYLGRKYDSCIKQCERTLELYPDFIVARQVLAMAYTQRREYPGAMTELRRVQALDPKNPMTGLLFAHLYAVSGRQQEAQRALDRVFGSRAVFKIPSYYVASVYAALGRKDDAFRWLDRAYTERSNWLIYLNLDPRFDPLRTDPRFGTLLSRIGPSS